MTKTIVFIHGMFQNPKSWSRWQDYFGVRGYSTLAPAWPCHEGEPRQLRENPPLALNDLGLEAILASMEATVRSLPDKPIVIGHSVGGLVAQLLAAKNLAELAIPIASVAPNRMMTIDWPFFKNVMAITNPLKGDDLFLQTPESFHGAFANTLSEAEARVAFEEYATHDSRTVLRDCLGPLAHVDFEAPHVPLLFLAGTEDQIVPWELVSKNAKAYEGNSTVREFKRSHYICGEPGWEEVAGVAHEWIERNGGGAQAR